MLIYDRKITNFDKFYSLTFIGNKRIQIGTIVCFKTLEPNSPNFVELVLLAPVEAADFKFSTNYNLNDLFILVHAVNYLMSLIMVRDYGNDGFY